MKFNNKIMLITYADSLGSNLTDLREVLDEHFDKAVGGVHILPFFPSSADRGFAPMRYDVVDEQFGTWDDVRRIGDLRGLDQHVFRQCDHHRPRPALHGDGPDVPVGDVPVPDGADGVRLGRVGRVRRHGLEQRPLRRVQPALRVAADVPDGDVPQPVTRRRP